MAPESNRIGSPFIELLSVDSTNNYAMGMVHAGMAQHGTAVFAHEQTRGKGQRNKQWLAQKDLNIILSVVIAPAGLEVCQSFTFSMAMALAAHRFFNKYADEETKIKWPNDLYWRDRKAGGILIENILQGSQWKYAVVGMGININQTAFDEPYGRAVSLRQITGQTYDTVALARELCAEIDIMYHRLTTNPGKVVEDYHQQLYKHNQVVRLKKGARVFDARIQGVNASGQLVTFHSSEEAFDIGEVEWVF